MNIKIYAFTIISLLFFSCNNNNQNTTTLEKKETSNHIYFEKSDYGLIFTTIEVNGKKVKAMIDFGDPNVLQLSSSFVEKEEIEVSKSKDIAKDLFGNTFEINEGVANEVIIGEWKNLKLQFSSSPGEMESVAEQINTNFEAVVGWGYFSQYYIEMDYQSNKFQLFKNKPTYKHIDFTTVYNKNSNYLSIPIELKSEKVNLIIDTGAPYSVIDSTFHHDIKIDNFVFKMGDKSIALPVQIQDFPMLKQLNSIGIIGGNFLAQYKIHIDPFEKNIAFEKQSLVNH